MRFKNNTRQLKKSIQGLRSFKDSLPKDIKKTIIKRAYIYSQIIDNWNSTEIVVEISSFESQEIGEKWFFGANGISIRE